MRIEPEFARIAVSGHAAPIVLACALVLAGLASPAHATVAPAAASTRTRAPHASGSAAFERDGDAVALEEQSLPPEDLASPTASPGASPAPPAGSQSLGGAGEAGSVAQATPATGPASRPAAQAAPGGTDAGGWTRVPAAASAASAATGGAPVQGAGAPPVAGEPAPEASPTEAPPPYDVGSVQPTAPVSDQPLTALIASTTDQPALNASLRVAERGRKALEASKPDDAIRELGRAISIDPTDPYAYFYLGRAYMMKKNYSQALAFFGRSEVGVRAVPAWLGEVKSFEGACLEEQGKFPEAAAAYKQALDVAPGNLMARTGYGRLSESLSDANAGNASPPPPPAYGAALPAPEVNLAAPAPTEAAPLPAQPDPSDAGADSGDDSGADSSAAAGAQDNQ
ncbi:MAG TPA: tetratricopeptide repeat protein [Candidatus Binataceae bacterium]|nr:tetratricopeptide repeat protein [Candidatus Binataceae bacterium]